MATAPRSTKASPKTVRVERCIFKRGPYSYQVKIRVGDHWITQTFDSLEDAQDFRDLKRVARSRDADFERVISARSKQRRMARAVFGALLERYRTERTSKKKRPTAELNRIQRMQKSAIAKIPFYMVTGEDITDLFRELDITEPHSVKFVAIIRNLYNVARKVWKIPVENPCVDMVLPKSNASRERRISKEEYRWLLDQLGKKIRRNRELIRLVQLAMATACRQGELAGLDWQHVSLETRVLTVIASHSKTGKTRAVPLIPDAIEVLRLLGGAEPPRHGPVFNSTQNALRLAWHRAIRRARVKYLEAQQEAGKKPTPGFLENLRFHDIRHEALSWMCENFDFLKAFDISSIAGHANLSMTNKYLHLNATHLATKMGKQLEEERNYRSTGQAPIVGLHERLGGTLLASDDALVPDVG